MASEHQDIIDWIEAHADAWREGKKYPGIEYWTLARTRARDPREFLAVVAYAWDHGRLGHFEDGKRVRDPV